MTDNDHSGLYVRIFEEKSVWDATCERFDYLFDQYDRVVISFSGGKDSTAVLNGALHVHRQRGETKPIHVLFYDEEAIPMDTIEYAERVYRNTPEIEMHWMCLPIQHRNACSNKEPFWYCWDPEKEDKWVRPMPDLPCVKRDHPVFAKGITFQDLSASQMEYDFPEGTTVCCTGIRAEESLRRLRIMLSKRNDCWINSHAIKTKGSQASTTYRAFPVYDWSSKDVWTAVAKLGWDYNRQYDMMNKTKMFQKYLAQRVCPPFGEEPLRGLWYYAQCYPEMWVKMLDRVDGVATAWRYSNTELYSGARTKPENVTYKQYLPIILKSWGEADANVVSEHINKLIKKHHNMTATPIPDAEGHPLTGLSWKFMCKMAIRGDFKARTAGNLSVEAGKAQDKLGITQDQANEQYGRRTQQARRNARKQRNLATKGEASS